MVFERFYYTCVFIVCTAENKHAHTDRLGSCSAVTDDRGEAVHVLGYMPYGETLLDLSQGYETPYQFTGYEKDQETGLHYAGARYYDSRLSIFSSTDPMWQLSPHLSPYTYCSNNPIMRIDPDGNWDINVHAYKNRDKSGYAVFIVKDRLGNEIYRTIVKTIGNGRVRNIMNSDTPQGQYKILGYRKTGEGTIYDKIVYGPNDLLALDYQGGEGGKRNGIYVHGGRQEGKYKGRPNLMSTHGCMRINDMDMQKLKDITTSLEQNDPLETKGYLTFTDDLNSPINYSINAIDRYNIGVDQFPKIENHIISNGYTLPCFVLPIERNNDVKIPYKLPDYE